MKSRSQSVATDVVVIGGGIAGVGAACAAADTGARVHLIERYGFFGGLAAAARVGTVCGMYYRNQDSCRSIEHPFIARFESELAKLSGTQALQFVQGLWFLPYDDFAFRQICDRWVTDRSIEFLFHSTVTAVEEHASEAAHGIVETITVQTPSESLSLRPKIVIDCSGGSIVSQHLGRRCLRDEKYQAGAVVFDLAPVAASDLRALHDEVLHEVLTGIQEGALPIACRLLSLVPGSLRHERVSLKLSLPALAEGDSVTLSKAETEARQHVALLAEFLRKRVPALVKSGVVSPPAQVGTRTGVRGQGEYLLTKEDLLSLRSFPECVAHGSWPLEWWDEKPRPHLEYFEMDRHYDIPAGALISADVHNLLFAGRMISASQEAISSARVIGTSLLTGAAAGTIAGAMAAGGSRTESVQRAIALVK